MLYQIRNIKIDTLGFHLVIDEVSVAVEPQVLDLIIYLVANRNRLVTRSELFENIWPDKVVSEDSISTHIKRARKILGDDGNQQKLIKTIHGRGFQFVGKVEELNLADEISDSQIVANSSKPESQNKQSVTLSAKKPLNKNYFRLFFVSITLLVLWSFYHYYQQQSLVDSVKRIAELQRVTYTAFIAQAERRNELVSMINNRLQIKRQMQFEKYFSFYFPQLNDEEKFVFQQIRSITESGLYKNNLLIVAELKSNPQIFNEIPFTRELQQHLIFWINKFESVFTQRQDMCLLYVGVEDGVPYPSDVNQNINDWLKAH